MDEYQSIVRSNRMKEIKGHAVAFLMLGLSLFALYTHTLYLAIIPLLWMAFRVGKEQGREQAHQDMEQASALGRLIQFPEREAKKPEAKRPLSRASAPSRVSPFTQH